jgi:hypothetical protein
VQRKRGLALSRRRRSATFPPSSTSSRVLPTWSLQQRSFGSQGLGVCSTSNAATCAAAAIVVVSVVSVFLHLIFFFFEVFLFFLSVSLVIFFFFFYVFLTIIADFILVFCIITIPVIVVFYTIVIFTVLLHRRVCILGGLWTSGVGAHRGHISGCSARFRRGHWR